MKNIINAFKEYFDEEIVNIDKTNGSQNNVYLINTKNNKYIIKQFIDNDEKSILDRKEQLRISKIWNDNGISCIQPLTDIFKYNDYYYIIYPFIDGLNVDEGELSLEQIKKLAELQAKIHSLTINSFLQCHLKKINYKDSKIQNIIDICNECIDVENDLLCICNNDFKPLNIIWKNDNPYIIDFDAVYKNHPSFSLLESAYTFSHRDSEINLDYYREYINTYKKHYNKEILDIDKAIIGSWNGKLQWLDFLSKNRPNDIGINNLTNQIINYQKYIDDLSIIIKEKRH